jgi:Ca2+-binding RTX toxin-like protein
VNNTDLIDVDDNRPGGGTLARVDLSNGPFTGTGGQIEFDFALGDGDLDVLALVGANDGRNFRFGTFLGAVFVNTNADALQDMIARDTELLAANGSTSPDRMSGEGGSGTGNKLDRRVILDGDAGDDVLIGGTAGDELDGGSGIDDLKGDLGTDELSGGPDLDVLDGGDNPAGRDNGDLASYEFNSQPTTVDLADPNFQDTGPEGGMDQLTQIERLWSGSARDTLRGNAVDNVLLGGDDDDVLHGRGADDLLVGQMGVDTASYEDAPAPGVTASLRTRQSSGADGNDTLDQIENLRGSSQPDALEGDALANTLIGLEGNDLLEGRDGDDSLIAGDGADTASYQNATAGVTVSLGVTGPQATGGAGADSLVGVENLTGSPQGDGLTGGPGTNVVSALAGDDNVQVRDGAPDTVDCGAGNDSVVADAVDNVGNCETVDNGVAAGAGAAGAAGGPGAADTSVVAAASARRVQDIVRQKAVLATAGCTQEPCQADGAGSVNVPRLPRAVATRRFRLRPARAAVPLGARRTLRLRLNRRTLRRVRTALRRGKRVSASVQVTVRDNAGNVSRKTLRVRAKRARRR